MSYYKMKIGERAIKAGKIQANTEMFSSVVRSPLGEHSSPPPPGKPRSALLAQGSSTDGCSVAHMCCKQAKEELVSVGIQVPASGTERKCSRANRLPADLPCSPLVHVPPAVMDLKGRGQEGCR